MIVRLLSLYCILHMLRVSGLPTVSQKENSIRQPLLVLLIDGFRWDYLDRYAPGELPGFQRFLDSGTKADYLVPDYPSDSYPNYYTLMTGLYTESHGMVFNFMWDTLYPDEMFLIGLNEHQAKTHWWNDAEPLWVTAEKQNQSTYMWFWPGCDAEIRGRRPSFCLPYISSPNPSPEQFEAALESALRVLANRTASIAGVYYERVDAVGHAQGPYKVDEAIRELDDKLVHMFRLVDSLGLDGTVNIVLFSDHGMSIHGSKNKIYIPDIIDETEYKRIILDFTSSQVWPREGELHTLYNKLKRAHPHLRVYKREEIPAEWHSSNHRRIPPLLLVADPNWVMTDYQKVPRMGQHGYDNRLSDVWGVFMATGPRFRANHKVRAFDNVNVYQVLCHVAGIQCQPHNGTWERVCEMFDESDPCGKEEGGTRDSGQFVKTGGDEESRSAETREGHWDL